MSKMSSHHPFGHLKHKFYGPKKDRESNWQFDSQPLKVKNRLIPLHVGGVQHTVGKFSTSATTLLKTSSQLEV
jgi:hypothetical protein